MITMRVNIIIFLFLPFFAFCQNENQLLTSKSGIFIEQNSKGHYGLVKSTGEIIIPVEKAYIKDNWNGGFLVYDSINYGLDYNTGIIHYHDDLGKRITSKPYSRITLLNDGYIVCYDEGMIGVIMNNGSIVTPVCFTNLNYLGHGLFMFETYNSFRGKLGSMLGDKVDSTYTGGSNIGDDGESIKHFSGVFNANTGIIGGENFRLVEYIANTNNPMLFLVQDDSRFEQTESGGMAIMNDNGQILSEYYYENVRIDDQGKIIGSIMTDEFYRVVELSKKGEVISIISEQK